MVALALTGTGNLTTVANNTATNTVTGIIPANAVVGDVLIAVYASDFNGSVTAPAGWTRISTARMTSGMRELAIFHAFTTDGVPAAPVFVQPGGTTVRSTVSIVRITGASQTERVAGAAAFAGTDTANTTGMTIPSTGATAAGITIAAAYHNANTAQAAAAGTPTFNGVAAGVFINSYGTGAAGASSSTAQAVAFATSPGPFTVAWGKTIANSNGTAVTIPAAAGGTNPEPQPEPEHEDEPGVAIQIGPGNVSTVSINQAGQQSISLPLPSRAKLGDCLIAVVGHSGNGSVSVDSAWTLLSNTRSGTNRWLAVYGRLLETTSFGAPVTFTSSEADVRMTGIMFRLTGVGADYLAAKGDWQVTDANSIKTGFTVPAAAKAGKASLVVMYANTSAGAAAAKFAVAGGTEIAQAGLTATGAATTTVAAFRAAGGGEKTVTISPPAANAAGFQITFQEIQPKNPASWEARVMKGGALVPATVDAVRVGNQFLKPSMVSWQPKDWTINDLFSTNPFFIAHRGSGDTWPEHTMEAYNNATAYGVKALELSVQLTADNILICHHDLNFTKTAKDSRTVRSMTYQQILDEIKIDTRQWTGRSSTLAPPPLAKDVIDAFIDTHVIFIEDKGGDGANALLNLMDTYPRGKEKFVWKQWAGAGQWQAAKDRGYKLWGYFMADIFSRIPELAPNFDYLGIPHTASDQVVADIVAQGALRGQPVIMWEIHYRWMFERAKALGVQGMMTSNIPYVFTTSTWQFREDQWHTGIRPAGDMPHTTDAGWTPQPAVDPANGGVLRYTERGSGAMVLGSMCPVALTSYAIEWEMRYLDRFPAETTHAGIWIGHESDRTHRTGATSLDGGYHIIQRVNGLFDLLRHDPNSSAGIPLATTQGERPVLGQWMKFRVEVTPEWITAKRLDGAGAAITSGDPLYRGQYFGVQKNFTVATADPEIPFEYRSVKVIPL